MPTASTGRVLRDVVKASARGAGLLSAGLRPLPDFLVIGTKRGGTTSLYFDLLEHPEIVPLYPPPLRWLKPMATKGVHYFDVNATRSVRWYRSYMPMTATRRRHGRDHGRPGIAGEASPYYLFHPAAAQRASEVTPDAKLIALLRNPIDRTYSHWKERRRNGAEELSFADALDAEPDRLRGEHEHLLADPTHVSYAHEQQSYATQSTYVRALEPWLARFPRHRLCVIASEEYYLEPGRVLGRVHSFLGLSPHDTTAGRVLNEAPGLDIDPATRSMLAARFVEPNSELERMLGQGFEWN